MNEQDTDLNLDELSSKMRWYVIRSATGYEKHVMRSLNESIKAHGMDPYFDGIFVPTEEVIELRGGKKRKSQRKFFPGYVLIKMVMNDSTWHLVKSMPKVLGFIGGTPDKPAPISESEAQSIINMISENTEKPKPKVLFEPGEMVRVYDGPFSGFNGVVEEINRERQRLIVAVLIFGRSTPVELDFSQVEKV